MAGLQCLLDVTECIPFPLKHGYFQVVDIDTMEMAGKYCPIPLYRVSGAVRPPIVRDYAK